MRARSAVGRRRCCSVTRSESWPHSRPSAASYGRSFSMPNSLAPSKTRPCPSCAFSSRSRRPSARRRTQHSQRPTPLPPPRLQWLLRQVLVAAAVRLWASRRVSGRPWAAPSDAATACRCVDRRTRLQHVLSEHAVVPLWFVALARFTLLLRLTSLHERLVAGSWVLY